MLPLSTSNPLQEIATQAATIDAVLLPLLIWMTSRYDSVAGAFRGGDAQEPDKLATAQARAVLNAVGLGDRLPHVLRMKLLAWPTLSLTTLAAPARGVPLNIAMRAALRAGPDEIAAVLTPFGHPKGGYTLRAVGDPTGAGRMSAAYHLLVTVRPAWFRARGLSLPPVNETLVRDFIHRLIPTHNP